MVFADIIPGAREVREKLWTEVYGFYHQALAASTQKQHASHVKWWIAFCVAFGCDIAEPREQDMMMYCALHAREVQHATVVQYLKGVKDFYAQ